jgi:hypothetical protein
MPTAQLPPTETMMKQHTYRLYALRALLGGCVIGASAPRASASPSTQTVTANDYNNDSPGNTTDLGDAVLASGSIDVSALTTTSTLVDQGWGGQADTNGIVIALVDNGTWLWGQFVAGAQHTWSTQTYDITEDPASLSGLDAALAGIDWSTDPTVSLSMYANGWGYPGWALWAQDNAFTVTSDTEVPEPAGLAMFDVALGVLGCVVRRGKAMRI